MRIKEFADNLTGLEQVGEPIEIKGQVTPAERDRLIELAGQIDEGFNKKKK